MQNFQWSKMTAGVCYYPEHWDKSLWRDDLQRMKKVGISVIRIGEFAWSKFEREEEKFTFTFFDEFLELCVEEKMQVIFGTPTATPPAWLTEKYPEVLNAKEDGTLYRHGSRRHYNYNSPKYRELSARIVEKIAEHLGKHPAIIGWQIDNEFNCQTKEFYAEADTLAFRDFLKNKYQTLEKLNEAWGTVFWNQTYTAWEQVYVPRTVLSMGRNPHQMLDYYRFISESAITFCKIQSDIVRRYKKDSDFITTNGMFGNLDNHRMTEECLDWYSYDCYPNSAYGLSRDPVHARDLNDRKWSQKLAEVRSVCPHFGVMEQQSGPGGWTTRMESIAPRPGQLTLWAMQSVAAGADFISFFRWRTACIGTEIYWHGILDYDNRDNRKLQEAGAFCQKLNKLHDVCGASYTSAFGLVKDYDNVWDGQVDAWHERVISQSESAIFEAAQLNHTPYTPVYLREHTDSEDLKVFPVLIYPHPTIMTNERAALLKQYVEQGGTLIIGCRSGYKQENGQCVMMPQPGLLQELTGSDVIDFTFTSAMEPPVTASWNGETLDMPLFNDIMTVKKGAKVLASYDNSYYQGAAALTENSYGKGKVLHLGSAFSRENTKLLLEYTGALKPFKEDIAAEENIEIVQRVKGGKKYYFVLNFAHKPQMVELKKNMTALYDDQQVCGQIELKAYETAVYML